LIGLALLLVGLGIFGHALKSIYHCFHGQTLPQPGKIALLAAVISISVKEIMYRYTDNAGKMIKSQAIIANAWHHRSDAFSSIGTMLGIGGAIFLGERWRVLDPVAALVVSFFILKVALEISQQSFQELTEASAGEDVKKSILELVAQVQGVSSPHKLRTRRIGNSLAIDLHITVDPEKTIAEAHVLTHKVEDQLRKKYGQETVIYIHTEPEKY